MIKRSICSLHSKLEDLITDIGELSLVFEDKKALVAILKQMRELMAEANINAQAMENRLKLYRQAIESLGYIRDKDNKLLEQLKIKEITLFELENL